MNDYHNDAVMMWITTGRAVRPFDARRFSRYPLLRAAVFLIAGLLLGHVWPHGGVWLAATAIVLVVAFALWKKNVWQSVALSLAWVCAGGWLMAHSMEGLRVDLPVQEVTYEAVITSEPVVRGKTLQADMVVMDGRGGMKVKASILRDTVGGRWRTLAVGTGIKARSLLTEPSNYRGGTFDYARYLREHGYRACTFIYKDNWQAAAVNLTGLSHVERTVLLAKRLRHDVLQRLGALGVEGREYAVVAALVLGDKSQLPKDLKDDYSISGASHVLALSGLHLSIVYGLLSFLLMGWRRKWLGQLLVMTLVWAYVVLVGFSPSVVRSAVMLSVCALVSLMQRSNFSLNTLSLAAVVMLCVNPLTLFDVGFQMSFMAVLGILVFNGPLQSLVSHEFLERHSLANFSWSMVTVSLSAQLLIFPLVICHFGRFSTYFLISNFIAIPCATLLLCAAVLLVPLSFFPAAGAWLAGVMAKVTALMNDGLRMVASWPGASIDNIHWTVGQTVAVYVVIACLYLLGGFAKRHGWFGHRTYVRPSFRS